MNAVSKLEIVTEPKLPTGIRRRGNSYRDWLLASWLVNLYCLC
jgi:hypothetical protein